MKLKNTMLALSLSIFTISGTAMAANITMAQKDKANDDASYSIGYNMGQTLKKQLSKANISIDNKALLKGFTDATNHKKPILTKEQIKAASAYLRKK